MYDVCIVYRNAGPLQDLLWVPPGEEVQVRDVLGGRVQMAGSAGMLVANTVPGEQFLLMSRDIDPDKATDKEGEGGGGKGMDPDESTSGEGEGGRGWGTGEEERGREQGEESEGGAQRGSRGESDKDADSDEHLYSKITQSANLEEDSTQQTAARRALTWLPTDPSSTHLSAEITIPSVCIGQVDGARLKRWLGALRGTPQVPPESREGQGEDTGQGGRATGATPGAPPVAPEREEPEGREEERRQEEAQEERQEATKQGVKGQQAAAERGARDEVITGQRLWSHIEPGESVGTPAVQQGNQKPWKGLPVTEDPNAEALVQEGLVGAMFCPPPKQAADPNAAIEIFIQRAHGLNVSPQPEAPNLEPYALCPESCAICPKP